MKKHSSTRLAGLAVVALGLTMTTAVPAVAAPAEMRATSCTAQQETIKYKSGTIVQQAIVTQLGARTLPPSGNRSVTTKVRTENNVTASATVKGSVSAKIGNKLIGQAEAKLETSLAAAGATTKTSETTVTEMVRNDTGRNRKYVFFRGTIKVGGGVLQSYCDVPSGSHFGTTKWKKVGNWRTFNFVDEGVAQCGAGTTGAVSKVALRYGCK